MSDQNVGTQTKGLGRDLQFFLTSVRALAPGVRPSKRPHLELDQSESKDKDEEEDTVVPHDSTYEPGTRTLGKIPIQHKTFNISSVRVNN